MELLNESDTSAGLASESSITSGNLVEQSRTMAVDELERWSFATSLISHGPRTYMVKFIQIIRLVSIGLIKC